MSEEVRLPAVIEDDFASRIAERNCGGEVVVRRVQRPFDPDGDIASANSPLRRLATFSTRLRSTITSPGEETNSLKVCME